MNPAVEYLERDYDKPGGLWPDGTSSYAPPGLFQVVPDAYGCHCSAGADGERVQFGPLGEDGEVAA